jgi:hypothetical protein
MEDWYAKAMNMKDDEMVEIPAECVEEACARINSIPPPPGEPIRIPAGLLRQANGKFTGDSPQSGEKRHL